MKLDRRTRLRVRRFCHTPFAPPQQPFFERVLARATHSRILEHFCCKETT
jgi:hypothetical protein